MIKQGILSFMKAAWLTVGWFLTMCAVLALSPVVCKEETGLYFVVREVSGHFL